VDCEGAHALRWLKNQASASYFLNKKKADSRADKPFLFYTMEDITEAGVKDIGIIVVPNKEQVAETVRRPQEGLAQTILIAEDFLDEDFVMYLGDKGLA